MDTKETLDMEIEVFRALLESEEEILGPEGEERGVHMEQGTLL